MALMTLTVTWNLVWFALALAAFHTSELGLAAVYMRHEFGWASLLITPAYLTAMTFGIVEHVFWTCALPGWHAKALPVAYLGAVLVVTGEAVRKTGMITAGSAFTHHIQTSRRPTHQLVRHGVYRYIRHPGYLGWMLWAVGLQVLLVNPVSTVIFTIVVHRFFKSRIKYEEYTLERLFGEQYVWYRARTPTWIPGIG